MHDWRLAWATADHLRAMYELYDEVEDEEIKAKLMEIIERHLHTQMQIAMN